MKYLLDTNTCIYLINERPQKVLAHFKRHSLGGYRHFKHYGV